MIIVVRPGSTSEQIDHILERIQELGFKSHVSRGEHRTIIGVIGDENKPQAEPLAASPGVEQVLRFLKPFKVARRAICTVESVVTVSTSNVGSGAMAMMLGPGGIELAL